MGDVCNNRGYVYSKMDQMIHRIPDSDAKKFADQMLYFCLNEPRVYDVSDGVVNDTQTTAKIEAYLAYRHSEEFENESQAYYRACHKLSERLGFLSKLKKQIDNLMTDLESSFT